MLQKMQNRIIFLQAKQIFQNKKMGNTEICGSIQRLPTQNHELNKENISSHLIQAKLSPSREKSQSKSCKVIFKKFDPLNMPIQEPFQSSVCEQEEERIEISRKLIEEEVKKKSSGIFSLQQILLIQEQKLQQKKIHVNWNSFIKIKKKNYLQDYIFVKELGRGAFGSVNKVKMKYGGLCRAIKIIKSSVVNQEKANFGKLFAEISVPMKLDHPNIVKLYEIFEYRGLFGLVMELCEGGDLFSNIKQSRFFSQYRAGQILKQILSAVNYMHKKGVIHRDIKPQNILVDNQSQTLKIADFGTATMFNSQTVLTDFVGTPYYIAPEVIQRKYNQKCDIWSCGVILYILLSGTPPFNGRNAEEIMQKIKLMPVEFKSSIWSKRNKNAKDLVRKMLNKNPSERITAQQALNSKWLAGIHDQLSKSYIDNIETEVVANLKSFHFKNKLKAVVYTFIASQLYSNKDKDNLLKVFREIDKDGDGVIEKEELIQVFNQHSTSSLTGKEIEKILQLVDTNGSGQIDFTEFLVAASNQQKLLEQQRLENAFNYLDADHSGYITIDEVKAFLDGTDQTNNQIKKIFDEVDENGDGTISKKEFLALLLKKQ